MSKSYKHSIQTGLGKTNTKQLGSSCISGETVSYLLHQLQAIRNLWNKHNHPQNNYTNTSNHGNFKEVSSQFSSNIINQIRQQIEQRVYLMEKKLQYRVSAGGQSQFEDFVTAYYEEQISKARSQMMQMKQTIRMLQGKIKQGKQQSSFQYQQSHQLGNNDDLQSTLLKANSYVLTVQQRQLSIKLKKQLTHCKQLLKQNELFINEQNYFIRQLSQQIIEIEERQAVLRKKTDQTIVKYNVKMKQNYQSFKNIQQELREKRKLYQKQLKQLQVSNACLNQQKTALEEQLLMKSQQVGILTKKIYELELAMTKYERQLMNKETQNVQSDEAILMINKEMTLWKQKFYQIEAKMNNKVKQIEDKLRETEIQKSLISKELEETQLKINSFYLVNEGNYKKKISTFEEVLFQKTEQLTLLQQQMEELNKKTTLLEKHNNKLQKLLNTKIQQMQQLLNEKQQMLKESEQLKQKVTQKAKQISLLENKMIQKLNNQSHKHNEQKSLIKKQIYYQVEQLIKINNETLRNIKQQQHQIKQMNNQLRTKQEQLRELQMINKKLQLLNEQYAQRNNELEQQIITYKDTMRDLQERLNKTNINQANARRMKQEIDKKDKQLQEKQTDISKLNKVIKELQNKLMKLSNDKLILEEQLQSLKIKKTDNCNVSYQGNNQINSQITTLKQQHFRKDFLIKQLQSKINLLQQQLRQTQQLTQIEKDKMSLKIKQLQDLLKERYDFSNRPSNQG